MAKRKVDSTAADLPRAKKLLAQYEKDVAVATTQFKTVRQALILFGKKLAIDAKKGDELSIVQEVVEGRHPMNANYFDSLGVLSQDLLLPLEVNLALIQSKLSELVVDKSQLSVMKTTIRNRLLSDCRVTRDLARERVAELESVVVAGEALLRKAQRRLRPLEQNLARRENGLLRWIQNTETLRTQVESLRQEIANLETNVRQNKELLDAAQAALANAQANLRPKSNHPELQESNEKIFDLSVKKNELKKDVEVLNRQLAAVRTDFGHKVIDLEKRFVSCSKSLFRAVGAVAPLQVLVPTIDERGIAVDWDSDSWLGECRKRRTRATVLLSSPLHSIFSEDQRTLRNDIIRDLTKLGNQREQQIQRAEALRVQQVKDHQKKRLREAQEQEKQRVKREQKIATANRKEIRRLSELQQECRENLEEFETEHRRLDNRIDQNSRARGIAEDRVARILIQIRTKNPNMTSDYVRRNAPRFVAYDNAQAAVDRLGIERQLLRGLHGVRARLRQKSAEADQRVNAEIRSQSSAGEGKRGRAPRIEVNEWEDAERLAEMYLQYLRYTDARRTGAGSDGGVDVESARAVAQVKDQSNPVGRPLIQQLYGVAQSKRKKAFFFARRYAPQAVEWARENDVTLYQFNRAGEIKRVD